MPVSVENLQSALDQYASALDDLEKQQTASKQQILGVLRMRDRVEHLWQQFQQHPERPTTLAVDQTIQLAQLDQQLQDRQAAIAQCPQLAQWRQSLAPPESAWWWHFPKPLGKRDRLDWLWQSLTLATLTLNASMATYILPKFLLGSTGLLSSFAALSPAVLTLLAGGGALTTVGQRTINQFLTALGVPKDRWQETKFSLSAILFIALLSFWSQFSRIAGWYTARGNQLYTSGHIIKAKNYFEQALVISPDYEAAHFGMGNILESLQQFDEAKTAYLIAAKAGYPNAYNNLAKLYLEEEQPDQAIPLLKQAKMKIPLNSNLFPKTDADIDLYYAVLKNLGWARLQQNRLEEAESALTEATMLSPDRVEGHCLLAQVLEQNEKPTEALHHWQEVLLTATVTGGDDCLGQANIKLAE